MPLKRYNLFIVFGFAVAVAVTALSSCVELAFVTYTETVGRNRKYSPEQIELLRSEMDRQRALAEIAKHPATIFTDHGPVDATDPARIDVATERNHRDAERHRQTNDRGTGPLVVDAHRTIEVVIPSSSVVELEQTIDDWLLEQRRFDKVGTRVDATGTIRYQLRSAQGGTAGSQTETVDLIVRPIVTGLVELETVQKVAAAELRNSDGRFDTVATERISWLAESLVQFLEAR